MYFHKDCGGTPLVKQVITTLTGLVITKSGVVPLGEGNIEADSPAKTVTISCTRCHENITDASMLVSRCMECGNEFDLPNLYHIDNIGGHYCRECCEEHFPGMRRLIVGNLVSKSLKA